MPELKWNQYDFIECFGVLPIYEEEYDVFTLFEVKRENLKLELSVWQHESLFSISLFQNKEENPFIRFYFVVRDKVRFINDKRGRYLEFSDCIIVESRFYYIETGELFNNNSFPRHLNIELIVDPKIVVKFE